MLQLVDTCSIDRSSSVGTNGRTQLQQLYTNVQCLVLPMNHTTAIEYEFSLGRAYDFFFAGGQDVKPADILNYNGSNYTVKAVQSYNVPLSAHVRALCEQEIS